MARGENLYGKPPTRGAPSPCVFISHRRVDAEMAAALGEYLLSRGVDIWLDTRVDALANASQVGDMRAVVDQVELGLQSSTHLVGLITRAARDSWWVPYEIGNATGRAKPVAHLVARDLESVPDHVHVGNVLPDLDALDAWAKSENLPTVPPIPTKGVTSEPIEAFAKRSTAHSARILFP